MNKNTQIKIATIAIAIITLTIIIALLWIVLNSINRTALQIYAITTTIAVPSTAWLFWWLGHTESRGYLKGIDGAITKMFHAVTITQQKPKPTPKSNQTPIPNQNYLPPITFKEDDSNKIINL